MTATSTKKAAIKSVFVLWSENGYINDQLGRGEDYKIEKEISFDKAEALFTKVTAGMKSDCGYDKTKICVNFSDGEGYEFRLDLSPDEKNIADSFQQRISYYTGQKEKGEVLDSFGEFWVAFNDNYEIKQAAKAESLSDVLATMEWI